MKALPVFLLVVASACPQVATEANRNYQTKEGRDALARGLGSPARDQIQKPDALVAALGIRPGMTVADVGTGVGFMLPWLSKAAGPSGSVIAEDIQAEFLDRVRSKISAEKLTNVKTVLGGESDPRLPAGVVDVELLLDVYHHFNYPEKMLAALARALRSDGRMAIVEYYRSAQPPGHIRLDRDEVIQEVAGFGYHLLARNDRITAQQYLLVFGK